LGSRLLVELCLNQALRIVAIRLVELPVAGKIDIGGRCLRKLVACTCRETHDRQNHATSHGAILY
jgi:hypothetical protein